MLMGEVELIKRSWQILDDEEYVNEKYEDLGSDIHEQDQITIENYLKSAPINYDWNMFLKNYLELEYIEGTPIAIAVVIENINNILAAAINVKNDFIVNKIKAYWEDEYLSILLQELLKMKNLYKLFKN